MALPKTLADIGIDKLTMLHMVVYLQVAIISQVLIFVTRLHSFFMERPSTALIMAFWPNLSRLSLRPLVTGASLRSEPFLVDGLKLFAYGYVF